MDSDSTMASSGSLFSRLLAWQRPPWLTAVLGLALIACPIIASALDGTLADLWREGTWRVALQAPLIILYIFLVAPILEQRAGSVVEAYRPLVHLDDRSFHRLVDEASRVNPVGEAIAFVVSVGLGALAQDWAFEEDKILIVPFNFQNRLIGTKYRAFFESIDGDRLPLEQFHAFIDAAQDRPAPGLV